MLLDMAYRLLREFRQAFTRLDTPPFSNRRHPDSGIAPTKLSLLVLAIGAGSRFLSHLSDAGFWLVKEYMGFRLRETFRYWSVLDCNISLSALAGVLVMDAVLP